MKKTTTEVITRKVPDNSPDGFTWETVTVDVALDGTRIGTFKGKWATCHLCNYTAPASEMGFISGLPYCYKHDCYTSTAYEALRGV